MQKVFTNRYAEGFIYSETLPHCLLIRWMGFWMLDDPDLKAGLDLSLKYIQDNQTQVLISDCTRLETLSEDVRDFLNGYWYPQATENGLRMEIFITAEDLISKISLEMLFEEVEQAHKDFFAVSVINLAQAEILAKKSLKNN